MKFSPTQISSVTIYSAQIPIGLRYKLLKFSNVSLTGNKFNVPIPFHGSIIISPFLNEYRFLSSRFPLPLEKWTDGFAVCPKNMDKIKIPDNKEIFFS